MTDLRNLYKKKVRKHYGVNDKKQRFTDFDLFIHFYLNSFTLIKLSCFKKSTRNFPSIVYNFNFLNPILKMDPSFVGVKRINW